MAKADVLIVWIGVVLSIVSVAALLIYAVKVMGDLPTEGIYWLAFMWLAAWNMASMGIYLAFLGAALWLFGKRSPFSGAFRYSWIRTVGLSGGVACLAGQLVDSSLGNPINAGYIGGIDDDLFSVVGQAISLFGAIIVLICFIQILKNRHP
jgi:hypothetical protein